MNWKIVFLSDLYCKSIAGTREFSGLVSKNKVRVIIFYLNNLAAKKTGYSILPIKIKKTNN